MFHFGAKTSRKPVEPAERPVEQVAVTATQPESERAATSTREVVELLEADLKRAGRRMSDTGTATRGRVAEAVTILDELRRDTDGLAEQTEAARADIAQLAEGFEELHRTAEEIGRRADTSQRLVDDAVDVAREASRSVEELRTAIEQIQAVVSLISDVAGQTNLLALNATIEAARAGAAGRGFAVVASEVKALSVETQKATSEIGATIGRLRATAQANIQAVDRIVGLVGEIGPVFGEVTRSVQTQIGTTAEIGRAAGEAARFTETVAEQARVMSAGMTRAAELGREVAGATDVMNGAVGDMTRQLVTVLRQTPEADRRRHDRWPVELRGTLRAGAARVPFRSLDLSLGGILVVPEGEAQVAVGARVDLDTGGLGTLAGSLVGRSAMGLHVRFSESDADAATRVAARVAELAAEYRPLIERAKRGAARILEAVDAALARGELSIGDLFDTDYRMIPGSAPVQFETRALVSLDRILPDLLEELLVEDRRMAFCAPVDVNGWLPVHNRIYSQPQRAGDLVWNTANARNRRIYDDRTGLLAARNTRPFLVQSYLRDLGGGNIVPMKEVDVPLHVRGRHWGGFRTAYRM